MNPNRTKTHAFALTALSAAALLAACGGGGGDASSSQPDAGTPGATTTDVSTRVVDGPLGNALVCLDQNANGACDAGEPWARSAADGSATLKVDPGDVGKYTLLALVGTDAVDASSGPVARAHSLRAPADHTAVISPLSTLVQAQMDAGGLTSTEADAAMRDLTGLATSLLADYTVGTSDANKAAATLAHFVVAAKQDAGSGLTAAANTKDSSGATITAADLDRAVERRLLDLVPSIVSAGGTDPAASPAVTQAAAKTLVEAELAVTPGNVGTLIGAAKQVDTTPVTPTATAGASLEWLTYADSRNWYFRILATSAAQSVPDASGFTHYTDERKQDINGVVQSWGDPSFTNTYAYFDGKQWFSCPADFSHRSTPRDANGVSESFYCNAFHSKSQRSVLDLAGRPMSDVVAQIRSYPLASTSGDFKNWGPDPASGVLGNAVFPAGSKLYVQTSTPLSNPDEYNTVASNTVRGYSLNIAAGGTSASACGQVSTANAASLYNEFQTLEQLIASDPGMPCVFATNSSTGPRNESWSLSTVSLGVVPGAASANAYYESNRSLRIAFDGSGNALRYYGCARRASDQSTRNCDLLGTGTYSIDTVADARVMRLANVPAAAAPLTYNRIFVERGGKVYYGFRTKLIVNNSMRPNAGAIDALFAQLGVSR